MSHYRLTPQGYLLHLDPVTNQMATVIPTAKAQQELVRAFHLDWGRHPHALMEAGARVGNPLHSCVCVCVCVCVYR